MRIFLVFFASALATSFLFAQTKQETHVLRNVQVVDVLTGKVTSNQAVLIERGMIKAVGDDKNISKEVPGSFQIDGGGKFLIPGLWDMHVHFEGAELVEDNEMLLPVFLAYGITTVRDCASDLGEKVLEWRGKIAEGKLIGPTIFTAGRKLEGKNSIWKGDLEIENETELRQMLDLLDGYKVDFVKITENTLHGDLFLKSVIAARNRGYRVSGHVPIDLTIQQLVDSGFTSIEHASYLLRLGSDEAAIVQQLRAGEITRAQADSLYATNFNQQKAINGYSELGEAGAFVCPTLIGGRELAYLKETDHSKDVPLRFLTEKFVSNYQWRIDRMANETPAQLQQRKDRYQLLWKQLPFIQQSGIRIIAGSDAAALNTYVYPAESIIGELEIFQEAGLTPLQILQSATINGARYFGIESKTATIEAGKNADLVLLDNNPLQNIHAIRSIRGVMVRGIYYDRAALDTILQTAREKKQQLDSQRK